MGDSSFWSQFAKTNFVETNELTDQRFDGIVLVTDFNGSAQNKAENVGKMLSHALQYAELNKSALKANVNVIAADKSIVPGGRLILSSTGPIDREYDTIRRYFDAGKRGMKAAIDAGCKSPLLVTLCNKEGLQDEVAKQVAAYGSLIPLYTPINLRESSANHKKPKLENVGFYNQFPGVQETMFRAFNVAKDIGEQSPERMTPQRVYEYIQNLFDDGIVKVSVIKDDELKNNFPLLAAVDRGNTSNTYQHARLIRLEYTPEGPVDHVYHLVGKGVTMDTGGVDVKIHGHMVGMCRDKFGAANVAGFFEAVRCIRPKSTKYIGYMCMVKNSIGSQAYTCDEIITARSGKRILINNTDAEGRLAMVDSLCLCKEEVVASLNPEKHQIITMATLTGHEILTYGYHPAVMENLASRKGQFGVKLQQTGDEWGQVVEISRLHQEDYEFHDPGTEAADIRQANNLPSTQTMRGHQTPAVFLQMASGIIDTNNVRYAHIDMGGCEGDHPGPAEPNPLISLVHSLVYSR